MIHWKTVFRLRVRNRGIVPGLAHAVLSVAFRRSTRIVPVQHGDPLPKGGPPARRRVVPRGDRIVTITIDQHLASEMFLMLLLLLLSLLLSLLGVFQLLLFFFFRHANVSKSLGRFVYRPLFANLPVESAIVLFQKPPGATGLSLLDGGHDLLDDFQLGTLGSHPIVRVVLLEQLVEEDVARVEPNPLAPPAQDVPVCGGKDLGVGVGMRSRFRFRCQCQCRFRFRFRCRCRIRIRIRVFLDEREFGSCDSRHVCGSMIVWMSMHNRR
mmetsp:Transcript_21558/g.51071  ORF Transcript_21558/g.51071 Transcript_21558/m.51071 type:complete len:268 (-) Transcript_21558:241-1044(-)